MACLVEEGLWIEWVHANFSPMIFTPFLLEAEGPSDGKESHVSIADHDVPVLGCESPNVITSSPQVGMPGPTKVRTPRSQLVSIGAEIRSGILLCVGGTAQKEVSLFLAQWTAGRLRISTLISKMAWPRYYCTDWSETVLPVCDVTSNEGRVLGSHLFLAQRASGFAVNPPANHPWWNSWVQCWAANSALHPGSLGLHLLSILLRYLVESWPPSPLSSTSSDTAFFFF